MLLLDKKEPILQMILDPIYVYFGTWTKISAT
jgi:hypothetical protein